MNYWKAQVAKRVRVNGVKQLRGYSMKVLFVTCQHSFQVYGGVEVQMLGIREHLERNGVKVKLFNPFEDNLADYDIIHLWRPLGNPLDSAILLNTAKKVGMKVVVSPIYWKPWKPVLSFEGNRMQFKLGSLIKILISSFIQKSGNDLGFASIYKFHTTILRSADLLLPNSWSEGHLIINAFNVNPGRIFPVPIGVEEKFANAEPDQFINKYGVRDFLLFVGRIEPRKNVLNLIKVFNRTKLETQLVIVGHTSDEEYYKNCLKAAEGNKNVIFCGFLSHESDLLTSAYAAAKALVLPSWYETPGIVALEAGLAGANIAITKIGGTTEYFKDLAFYIDPTRTSSILKALIDSWRHEYTSKLKDYILKNYTMDKVAIKTLEAYKKVLGS